MWKRGCLAALALLVAALCSGDVIIAPTDRGVLPNVPRVPVHAYDGSGVSFHPAFSTGGVAASPLLTNLIFYLPLQEASGTRYDAHGSNDFTDNGTVGSATGKIGNAALFADANNEWLDIDSNADLTLEAADWTIALWIKPDDLRDEGAISNYVSSNAASSFLLYLPGTTYITWKTVSGVTLSAGTLSPTGSINIAAWNFVVAGWDESLKKNWVQVNAGIVTLSGALGTPNAGTNKWEIGRRSQSTTYDWEGMIGPVAFWKRKLTQEEVIGLYNSFSGLDYPFTAYSVTDLEALFVGDSKTANGTTQIQMVAQIGGVGVLETHSTIATAGHDVAATQAAIDANLSASSASPAVVLINLGANDVDALPVEATLKANYLYVLDALHTKWPSAQVYLMRPWRRGYAAESNTFAGWIADIVTARSTFVHLGPDERVFLEGGDDGATYTSDGVHPNAAGYALTAAQWITSIGY